MAGNKSNVKKRNWAFVVYPESAPSNWIDLLQQTGLQCAISPLHDKDLNADDTVKKSHWHVVAVYSGPTSFNVVNVLCQSLNAPIPQALESVRGYYRYLTHKDNPEKAQYNENEVTSLNGFNIADFVELTKSEVNSIIRRLQLLIKSENIIEYSDFMDYLLEGEMYSEHEVASSHTYFFDRYITSLRNKLKGRSLVDENTGEVL